MRKLLWFTVGFAAACAHCAYLFSGTVVIVIALALAALGAVMMFGAEKFKAQKVVAMVMLGLAVGFCWYQGYTGLRNAGADTLDGERHFLTVTASDYGYETNYGTAADGTLNYDETVYKVRVFVAGKVDIEPGDRIEGEFRIDYTGSNWNPEDAYFSAEGTTFLLYGDADATVTSAERVPWYCFPAILRRQILKSIEDIFPVDVVGFAKALLLGDTSGLSYRVDTNLKTSGLRHVAAVSGLHVSILFSFVYMLFRKRMILTTAVMFPVLILFAAISGFSASVVRACVMHLMMQAAFLFRKEKDEPTSLSFAVLLLLVINPQSIMSVGLQLSVTSVIGIQVFCEKIRERIKSWKLWGKLKRNTLKMRLVSSFAGSIAMSLSASVFTIPLTAIYFGTVSLVAVLSNLLCLWLISFVFCSIAVACLVGIFWSAAGKVIAYCVSWLIRFILWMAGLISSFPMAVLYTESPYVVMWLILSGVFLSLFAYRRILKLRYVMSVICAMLILAVGLSWLEPRFGQFRVTVLDVGQGQSVLIQTEGKSYLVDCGGDGDKAVADKVSAHLLSRGVFRLDGLIFTHYDKDHVGAAEYLLQRLDVDTLYLPVDRDAAKWEPRILSKHTGSIQRVAENMDISLGEGVIRIFTSSVMETSNESSLCILFQKANYDILITGDRGALGELALIVEEELPQLEALVVGHHGAAGSTSAFLLETLRPQTAVISVGADNAYGHPSAEVLERLTEYNCEIRRTDLEGTIVLTG